MEIDLGQLCPRAAQQLAARERCVSGLSPTRRHEPDQEVRHALLTRGNSTARQRRAPLGKDSIPLLKRVSQVRILPGAQSAQQVRGLTTPRSIRTGGRFHDRLHIAQVADRVLSRRSRARPASQYFPHVGVAECSVPHYVPMPRAHVAFTPRICSGSACR